MNGKMSARYSRHYYDLYCMAMTPVIVSAFSDLALLERVVTFKERFYQSNAARYDLALPGTMKLMPPEQGLSALREDYRQMGDMIFGEKPSFEEIMATIRQIEHDINQLAYA